MSRSRSLLATAFVGVLLLVAGADAAHAQAILDGKITGTVTSDDKVPLPGATVEISSPALIGGRQTTTTTARGTYVFLNVPVGTYRVVVSRDAFKTMVFDDIDVSAASVVTIDAILTVGTVTETVNVTAEGAMVDGKTSTVDAKLGKDMLDRLPTSRDAFYDLATTTPGMFDVGNSGGWLPSPTAYGGAGNENVFLVNGVNTTNPRGAQFGSLVKVNYDTVEEVRVVALGSKAEYGSYSGAAIDVLTRSGSNDYHGSVAFYSRLGDPANNQPGAGDDLGRDWLYIGQGEQLAGETKSDWEGNFTLGGPIMKDKVWFFTAFDYVYNKSLPPRWSLENTYSGRYFDAKVSAQPFTKHRAWVAYHYENNKGDGWSWGSEPEWDTSMTYGVKTYNNTVSAQWQYFPASTTVLSAKYLGFWTDDQPFVPSDAPDHPGYINWWKWSQYGVNGAFPYVEAQKSNRQTIQGDLSYYAEDFIGQHDMKFGVQYTKGRGNWMGGYFQNYVQFMYPYRWTQNVGYMQSWYGDTGLMFYNNKNTLNPFLTVRTADSVGAFFDDQWTPSRRLTINLGLRFDHMSTKYETGKVYELIGSPEEINGPPPVVRDRQSTDNIFDFKTWSPRIGLSYLLTEDGKTVARASYGRYYLPLSVETLRRFGPDMPLSTQVQEFYMVGPWSSVDTNGDGMIDSIETRNAARLVYGQTPLWVTEPRTIDQSWTLTVADGVKDQFTDQFTLNLERELAKNFSVSATYIYKHAGNIFANIPINEVTQQEWEYERIPYTTAAGQTVQLYSVVFQDYNGDGQVNGADVQWVGDHGSFEVRNMGTYDGVKPKRDYHGLQLVLNKRYSNRWLGRASFVYSSSSGIAARTNRQDNNMEGPMVTDDNWMGSINDTINNLETVLPFTPEYEVKVSGSYRIPKIETDFGLQWRMRTGKPLWYLETYPQHTQWANPPGGVIATGGGDIVGVTEPDYLPTLSLLDLRLEKQIKLGGSRSLNLVVDGFNVFNAGTATQVDYQWEYGKITGIPAPRRFRGSLRFNF